MAQLSREFFNRSDVLQISKDLIGCKISTQVSGIKTEGLIIETEAYCGLTDKACHAHLNKKTERTKIFYEEGGVVYVYLCYGIHHLFNIITGKKDEPKAVLVRAVLPTSGTDTMKKRRGVEKPLSDGPGKMTQAFGIDKSFNGLALDKNQKIKIFDRRVTLKFKATPRIGIDYAGEDAFLPWRFVVPQQELNIFKSKVSGD